jgi:predicted phosphodiesterase
MKVAVVSDIHANAHALSAVLAETDRDPPDELWCLGDVVGYGPDPNECCATIASRAGICLAGNHDLAVLGVLPLDEFNADAAAAARWTRSALDEPSRTFLSQLEPSAERAGVELFHGSPADPVWDYVLSAEGAESSFRMTSAPLVLVGHSHVQLALHWDGGSVTGGVATDGDETDLSSGRWLLNPGSVGQPRGNDPRAAFLELDLGAHRARFRRIPYDVEATQAEILAHGLPAVLAERLSKGL